MMHPLTSAGHRPARRTCVPVVVAAMLASATLLAILDPTVTAFADSLRPREASAQALAVEQSASGHSVVARGGQSEPAASSANAYGGSPLTPGRSNTQTLTFTNAGTASVAAFTATAAGCAQAPVGRVHGSATDLCDRVLVRLVSGGSSIFEGTAAAFGRAGALDVLAGSQTTVAPGRSVAVEITITLSAGTDNRYQGLQIDQPIQWRFGN